MPKKNKFKALKNKARLIEQGQAKESQPELMNSDVVSSSTDTKVDLQDLVVTANQEDQCEVELQSPLAGIETMSERLDEHIKRIEMLQKELTELQIKQLSLLDGCVHFFHELQTFKAQNDNEAQIVFKTFMAVKEKVKIVFEQFLPSQLDALERDLALLKYETKPE